jgi:hypothetical protein
VPFISGGGGGGGSGGLTKLFSSTLSGAASSIDSGVAGFSTSLSVLYIYLVLRTNDAGTGSGNALITFNNDAGANYNQQNLSAINATVAGAQNLARNNIGVNVNSAGDTANYAASLEIVVPGYAATTFAKAALVTTFGPSATTGLLVEGLRCCSWSGTAAINRVAVATGGAGTYNVGSSMTIYGT